MHIHRYTPYTFLYPMCFFRAFFRSSAIGGCGGLAQDKQTEDAESFKKAFARLDGAKEAQRGRHRRGSCLADGQLANFDPKVLDVPGLGLLDLFGAVLFGTEMSNESALTCDGLEMIPPGLGVAVRFSWLQNATASNSSIQVLGGEG